MHNGMYYGEGYQYHRQTIGDIAGPNAANWNEINWTNGVKDNFTIFLGACQGAEDAGEILNIIHHQNPDIRGMVGIGRNYDGHWQGGTGNETGGRQHADIIWYNATEPIGFVRYGQDTDGNVIKTNLFEHPASQYLLLNNGQGPENRPTRLTYQAQYNNFIQAMGTPYIFTIPEIMADLQKGIN
jgi:hypothetical protein